MCLWFFLIRVRYMAKLRNVLSKSRCVYGKAKVSRVDCIYLHSPKQLLTAYSDIPAGATSLCVVETVLIMPPDVKGKSQKEDEASKI